jgi:flagellar biogenesis protein FliO
MFIYDEQMNKIPVSNQPPKQVENFAMNPYRANADSGSSDSKKKKMPTWYIALIVVLAVLLLAWLIKMFVHKSGSGSASMGMGKKAKFGFRFY